MFARVFCRPANCFTIALAAMFGAALGCGPKEQIRTYTVAKETPAASPEAPQASAAQAADAAAATDRMLVAILPAGRQAMFFKVVGPAADVDKREADITKLFESLKVADGRPSWTAPEGWKEDGAAGMRAATLWVPTDGKPLEMSVTPLPWGGTEADLVSNVNRWRRQMQLAPIGPQQLKDVTSEIKAGDATVTVVDLKGRFAGGGMMAPFAGGGFGANRAVPRTNSELPAGHPPIDSPSAARRNAPAATAAADVPKFEVPESWQPVAPASSLRKAEFAVGNGPQASEVTLIDFSTNAGPMIADPLSNVNRWRNEIDLAPIEKDQLKDAMESIEIDGKPANYVRLMPDPAKPEESKAENGTMAAMVTVGERVWFIKLKGPRDLVIAEEDNFKAFLDSMEFAADTGAPHGDK